MRRLRISDCASGVALIEFAMALPLLLLLLIGVLELSRFAILQQKLDKLANAMADYVTQGTTVSACDLNSFSEAAQDIMNPFAFDGTIVFSSVAFFNTPLPPCEGENVACITWQQTPVGSEVSEIGSGSGSNAHLPGGYAVASGQNVIVAETFLNYTPLLPDITGNFISALGPQILYKAAVYKPRQGTLTSLSGC